MREVQNDMSGKDSEHKRHNERLAMILEQPEITLDIYTHANMDQQREAMDAMQDVFG